MKLFWKAIKLIFYIVLILSAHIFIVNFLPFPFNQINIIFSSLLLFLTISPGKNSMWLALIISYFSELFSSIPFGIATAALLISLLIINWFQLNILTNRSLYMVFLSAILGIILYRILFICLLTINNYFHNLPVLPYSEIVIDAGWEVLLSSLMVFALYFLNYVWLKYWHKSSTNNTRIYG